eukprot:gene14946-31734_t
MLEMWAQPACGSNQLKFTGKEICLLHWKVFKIVGQPARGNSIHSRKSGKVAPVRMLYKKA